MPFVLRPRLEADTLPIRDLALCHVLLMDDARYPWLILVPARENIREIHELVAADQQLLMQEIAHVSRALQALTQAHKMNVAALGNQVPQLHVHIIARMESDAAWPNTIWGSGTRVHYRETEKAGIIEKIKSAL